MGSLLAALTVPFAQDMAGQRQQTMFADRLEDTIGIGMAAAEQLDVSPVDDQELSGDISRYAALYGIGVAVISRAGTVQVEAGPDIDFTGAEAQEVIASGLAAIRAPTRRSCGRGHLGRWSWWYRSSATTT